MGRACVLSWPVPEEEVSSVWKGCCGSVLEVLRKEACPQCRSLVKVAGGHPTALGGMLGAEGTSGELEVQRDSSENVCRLQENIPEVMQMSRELWLWVLSCQWEPGGSASLGPGGAGSSPFALYGLVVSTLRWESPAEPLSWSRIHGD